MCLMHVKGWAPGPGHLGSAPSSPLAGCVTSAQLFTSVPPFLHQWNENGFIIYLCLCRVCAATCGQHPQMTVITILILLAAEASSLQTIFTKDTGRTATKNITAQGHTWPPPLEVPVWPIYSPSPACKLPEGRGYHDASLLTYALNTADCTSYLINLVGKKSNETEPSKHILLALEQILKVTHFQMINSSSRTK